MMNAESIAVYSPFVDKTSAQWKPPARGANILADKTVDLALGVIDFYAKLPSSAPAQVLGKQVLRSGTSVGSQYREACRARSIAEFISKNESALQELDETLYWFQLFKESNCAPRSSVDQLALLAEEVMRLLVATVRTAKRRSGRDAPVKQP